MRRAIVAAIVCLLLGQSSAKQNQIKLVNNTYTDILIAIKPEVPEDPNLLQELKKLFTSASEFLYTATKRRAKFGNINILVPANWTGEYFPTTTLNYEESDIRIVPSGAGIQGNEPHTVQIRGCKEFGEYTSITSEFVVNDIYDEFFGPKGKVIVHEWAHLRWGVFDEYATDVYPAFYLKDPNDTVEATRCPESIGGKYLEVDPVTKRTAECVLGQKKVNPLTSADVPLPINKNCTFFPSIISSSTTTASIMSFVKLPDVIHFCHSNESDPDNKHNEIARNKHNHLCNRQSTWDVITSSDDFANGANPPSDNIQCPPPKFTIYQPRSKRRFALVLDTSGSMRGERLTQMTLSLRALLEKMVLLGDYVAMTEFSSFAFQIMPLTEIRSEGDRQSIIDNIPKTAQGGTCIGCGLREGVEALTRRDGSDSCGEVILFSDGKENAGPFVDEVKDLPLDRGCRVHTVFFETNPSESLKNVSKKTGGKYYFAHENDLPSMIGAFLTLSKTTDGSFKSQIEQAVTLELERSHVEANKAKSGQVFVDGFVGRETVFQFFFLSDEAPLVTLTSPDDCNFSTSTSNTPGCEDRLATTINSKTIEFRISGTATNGTWEYRITSAVKQEVTVFVTSKPRGGDDLFINVRTWFTQKQKDDPILLIVMVTIDDVGLSNLIVQATIKAPNGTEHLVKIQDNGIEPDIQSNDGVYGKHFVDSKEPGKYTMNVKVQNAGSVAIESDSTSNVPFNFGYVKPDGSLFINPHIGNYKPRRKLRVNVKELGRFSRIDTAEGLELEPPDDLSLLTQDTFAPNRITDLKVRRSFPTSDHDDIVLEFTAPGDDSDEGTATRYEICYTFGSAQNLVRKFLNNMCVQNFSTGDLSRPKTSGGKEMFILTSPKKQGKSTIQFAVRAWDEAGNVARISNIASLNIKIAFDGCHSRRAPEGMIANPDKGKYNLGEVVTFKCISPRHKLVGSPTSSCEGPNNWSNQVPTCKTSCLVPKSGRSLSSLTITPRKDNYLSADVIWFSCLLPFVIRGSRRATCRESGRWSTPFPKCIRQCSLPLIPAKMSAKPSKVKYNSGDVVYFTCVSDNLLLTGSTSSSCQDSGSWSSQIPSCQTITCSPAHSNPTNGLVNCSKSNNLGSVCTFRCDSNFELIGSSESVCENDEDGDDDGVWSRQAPVCRTTCASRNLTRAKAVNRPCRKTCWPGSGRCKRGKICKCDHECGYSCINPNNTCGRPSRINHVQAIYVRRNVSGSTIPVVYPPYLHDDFIVYECQPGYTLNQFKPIMCHGRRNWTGGNVFCTLTCEPKNVDKIAQFGFTCGSPCVTERDCNLDELCLCDGSCGRSCVNPGVDCGEAPASSNAAVNYTGQGFYRVANYSCVEGFYLVSGSPTRKCTGGGIYDGSLPHCSRIECSDPFVAFEATGGEVARHRPSTYNIGVQVEFRCPFTHRLLGPTFRTCLIDGRWSGLDSACDLNGHCSLPLIPAKMSAKPSKAKYDSGDVVYFTCESDNLVLVGSSLLSCQDSGSWSSQIPSCQTITCSPAHSNPTNGLVKCSKSNNLGSVCTFRCNSNFALIGSSESVCEDDEDGDADGVWSRQAPVCRKPMKLCTPITNFENGSMTIRVDYKKSITFKCNGGFNLVGTPVMKCVNGTWSTPVPTCQRGSPTCSMIVPPKNGKFSPVHVGDSNEKLQLAIKVSCNEGYTLDPTMDEVVFCNKTTGQWSGGIASCIKIFPCPAIPLVENGSVRIENVTMMNQMVKVATFICSSGYELVGERSLSCSDLGYWSNKIPTCEETRSCEIPTVENGGHQVLNPQSRNLRVMFWCKIGYTMLGSSYNRCDRGHWTLTVPTCEMNPNCPLPAPPANMNVAPISSFYQHGSRVTYSCKKTSDELVGTRTMICFRGKWQGNKPICRTRLCPVPTPPQNGSVMVRGHPAEQTPNSRIVFGCNNNLTLFGSNTSTCQSYGYWIPSTPICAVNRTCPLLEPVANGKTSSLSGTAYPHVYSRVQVRCDPYYESHGSTYLTCRPGGVWSNSMPTCRERATCPNLSIPNSMVDAGTFPKPYLYTHVTVTCAEGYQLDGSTKIHCRGSRKSPQWSPAVPMCRPTHGGCKPITSIPHGRVTNSAAFGVAFLVFDCDSDYVMQGQAVMHCTSKGKWDPPLPPVCQDATAPSKEDM